MSNGGYQHVFHEDVTLAGSSLKVGWRLPAACSFAPYARVDLGAFRHALP